MEGGEGGRWEGAIFSMIQANLNVKIYFVNFKEKRDGAFFSRLKYLYV